MTPADATGVLATSREEHALYDDLVAVYRELVATLAEPGRAIDRAWLAARHAAAEGLTARLRVLAADLAPHRLGGEPVAPDVAALWRRSAALAVEAARANADATALARARQAELVARLAQLNAGRQGLAGYRPAADPTSRAVQVA